MSEEVGSAMGWYVLRAIGGRERKVKRYLEEEVARLHLEDYLRTVLVPLEKTVAIRNGKKVAKEVVLYPSYVFIEAELTPRVLDMLRDTPDALGFLLNRKDGDPMPLKEEEKNRMLGLADEASEGDARMMYKIGQEVRVIDGPFNTFVGVVSEVYPDKGDDGRLVVLMQIFERRTPLELSFKQVECVR